MNVIKTTVYLCSSLMLGAAVFGAIDYNNATQKGTLKTLYKEEEAEVNNNLILQAKKEVDFDDYSRKPFEDRVVATPKKNKVVAVGTKKLKAEEPATDEFLTNEDVKVEKRNADIFNGKKRISIESFSRAPLTKKWKVEKEEAIKIDTALAVIDEKTTME